jgi:dolichyl-phosphate-mannose-protein mannosyltransferase
MTLAEPLTKNNADSSTPQRVDYFAVVALCGLAFLFRAWNYSQLGLTHFDEGIYAWSGFWALHKFASPALNPWQKLFSPPGYFGLVGIAYWLCGGPSALAAIGINILVGSATVALVWWMGCRWFGRRSGLLSAALAVCGEFQIAFSRTAMTDTLFAFLFLLALALIALWMERERPSLAVLAGAAVGAAWNVKYHGWLALGIAGATMTLALLTGQLDRAKAKQILFQWGLMAAIAVACFLPWFLQVQIQMGGYAEVEAFHNKFLDFHWISNFVRQVQEQLYFEGWLSRLTPAFPLLMACLLTGSSALRQWKMAALLAFTLFLSGMAVGAVGTEMWLATFGVSRAWKKGGFLGPLLVSGFIAFFILTPCYTPYARLLLPWTLMAQLLAGASLNSLLAESAQAVPESEERKVLRFFVGAWALFLIVIFAWGARKQSDAVAWDSSVSSRDAAQQLMAQIPKDAPVFVVAEPQLAFYFRCAGYQTYSLQHLAFNKIAPDPITYSLSSSGPIYVVGGFYARDEYDWNRILAAVPDRFRAVAKVTMRAGDIRLLDDMTPSEATAYKANPDARYDLDLLVLHDNTGKYAHRPGSARK